MDSCPPIIIEPAIRDSWTTLDAATRAALVAMFASRREQTAGHAAPLPAVATSQPAHFQAGMPPPRGNPYGDDGATAAIRRRRLSSGGSYVIIDPALQADDEAPSVGEYTELLSKNNELEARVRTLESHISMRAGQTCDGRTSGYSARGGRHRRRVPRRGQPHAAGEAELSTSADEDEDYAAVFQPDLTAQKNETDALMLVQQDVQSLSPMQKKALSKIQSSVTASFRETTGVLTTDQPWPKWSDGTEFPGMAVNFEATVEHRTNRALFRRVAEVALQDLKKHASVHADWMNAPDVKLTLGLLYEVAKRTFRGFKRKCSNLLKATAMYVEKHGIDPTPLIVQEMMSDEASGPEDEETELKADWKRRMAERVGITNRSDAQLEKMVFFEVVHPNWRSEALTAILHELWDLFWAAVSTRTARAMTPRVTGTERTSDDPPQFAPYNFGVNRTWYDRYKDTATHRIALKDWLKYPDPVGFGENQAAPQNPEDDGVPSSAP
ncbi:hypothetical protein BN946_scf184941.g18 [Trametes cinnabarina]|uniref:Uncharacterized protein n=1 Tax=Pycnoporus cinnabarinus TaxID=5643 RepID=A0A060SMP9_PYCCI|nr:hypothetical protein BN946_scf184941.g18 [Trametes cinnabarina]